ncbi:MAG TPA: ABATE domain-containing protein, partial [Blastocatellia bacterium]|nr:ABATE domain-containing protein [Blastocatellia bacterium]
MKTFAVVDLPAAKLRLVGGSLCLDFANTVGGRRTFRPGKKRALQSEVLHEKLTSYDSLIGWALHAGVLRAGQTRTLARKAKARRDSDRLVGRALALREAVYRIFR